MMAETVATPGAKVIGEDSIGLRVESSRPPELLSKETMTFDKGSPVWYHPSGSRAVPARVIETSTSGKRIYIAIIDYTWMSSTHSMLSRQPYHSDWKPWLMNEPLPTETRAWQPIKSAPKSGEFMVLVSRLPWPAHAQDGRIYSNAHGLVNELDPRDRRMVLATHWMPMPELPHG